MKATVTITLECTAPEATPTAIECELSYIASHIIRQARSAAHASDFINNSTGDGYVKCEARVVDSDVKIVGQP